MTLSYFSWKRAAAGAVFAPALIFSVANNWSGESAHLFELLPWLSTALWVAAGVGAVVGGFMGEEVWDLPERFGDWLWNQFFGPSV